MYVEVFKTDVIVFIGIIIWFDLLCFNATFSNISAISWQPVLVVEETGVPGENHRPWAKTDKLYHLRLRVECTLFCNLQSRVRTHAVLVIGLYELLGNPTNSLSHPGYRYYTKAQMNNLRFNIEIQDSISEIKIRDSKFSI
jgi:hypothetical protein